MNLKMHNITSLGIKVFLPLKSVTVEFPGSILGIDTDDPRYGNFGNLSGNERICSRKPFFFLILTSGIFNLRRG